MKKYLFYFVTFIIFSFLFSSCGSKTIAATDVQLKTELSKYSKQPILFFQSMSIGKNQRAAFTIVDSSKSTGWNSGEAWYVTDTNAKKLQDQISLQGPTKTSGVNVWQLPDTEILKCETYGADGGSSSYAWYIKNGGPLKLQNTGTQLQYSGNGQFTTADNTFDADYNEGYLTGHTYKTYYLYWNDGGFKEYGGIKITQQEFLNFTDAQGVLDSIAGAGKTVDDIFYRQNDIININYHDGNKQNGSNGNVTLKIKNNAVSPTYIYGNSPTEKVTSKTLNDFNQEGIYKSALYPEIAIYPNKLPN